jgi:hypothetical protein
MVCIRNQRLCLSHQDQGNDGFDLHGFVDEDWVGDVDKKMSTSENVFHLFQ